MKVKSAHVSGSIVNIEWVFFGLFNVPGYIVFDQVGNILIGSVHINVTNNAVRLSSNSIVG